jgi:hypothetical protein
MDTASLIPFESSLFEPPTQGVGLTVRLLLMALEAKNKSIPCRRELL